MKHENAGIWWGPPKKFSTQFEERKISWLELFYDLVYVIAISRITHYLSEHQDFTGFLDYTYLFGLIFWGWLNGSMHHDIHGSTGLRTNLMTLWQMMIIAALIVTLGGPPESRLFNATIAIMVMQVFITYLWWSVGIYDKSHRKLNLPYTVCYLASLALMSLTFFAEEPYVRVLFYLSLLLNYLPPFWVSIGLKDRGDDFSLSASMAERLGLFTIIIFGEVVLGVINGVIELKNLNFQIWANFGLAVLIVFALWWIFFAMIGDKPSQKGLLKSSFVSFAYIPTLMSLGVIGVAFTGLFNGFENTADSHEQWIGQTFFTALSVFLTGILVLTFLLEYPPKYLPSKGKLQRLLVTAAAIFFFLGFFALPFSLAVHLLIILGVLLAIVVVISKEWLLPEG